MLIFQTPPLVLFLVLKLQDSMSLSAEKLWRIDLAYDGKKFSGFQSQPCGNTIQDHLESALSIVLHNKTKITGGSRTDAGVHAEHQVCVFRAQNKLNPVTIVRSVNALLPAEIKVVRLLEVDRDFHPHRSSVGKIYRYRLWKGYCLDPFAANFVWEVKSDTDANVLLKHLGEFVGEHDFLAFSNSGSEVKSTIRKLYDVQMFQSGPLIEIWFEGNGFLKQMVRNIVGTVVDLSQQKLKMSVSEIMQSLERSNAGQTAPPRGLSLVRSNFIGDISTLSQERLRAQNGFSSAVLS